MPVLIELLFLITAFVLTAIALIESPRNYVGWAVMILVLLALYPRVG